VGAAGGCSSTTGSGADSSNGSSVVVAPPSETSCCGAGGVRGASFSGLGVDSGFGVGSSGSVSTRFGGATAARGWSAAPRGTSVTGNKNCTAANIVAPTADAAASGQARMRAASIKLVPCGRISTIPQSGLSP
jgi:hypothetical protein